MVSLALLSPGFALTSNKDTSPGIFASNVDLSVSALASHRHDTGSVSVACHKVMFWDHFSFQFIYLTNQFLANVNSRSRSLYAIARPSVVCRLSSVVCRLSVCLSYVTFVRPTQAVQIFGNISIALGT